MPERHWSDVADAAARYRYRQHWPPDVTVEAWMCDATADEVGDLTEVHMIVTRVPGIERGAFLLTQPGAILLSGTGTLDLGVE